MEILDVKLLNVTLPRKLSAEIEALRVAKMSSERAKSLEELAMAQQGAQVIKAETAKKLRIIEAEAEKEVAILRAEGEAEALKRMVAPLLAGPLGGRKVTVQFSRGGLGMQDFGVVVYDEQTGERVLF